MQSLQRAFEILERLSDHSDGLSLAELTPLVGLSKSTVHRFLSSLRDIGYVAQDVNTGKYRLTMRMFEIGSRTVRALNILDISRPYLTQLLEKTGNTVHLVTVEHDEVLYIYKNNLSSGIPLNIGSLIGNCAPMYCTGVGKAILAFLSESEVERVWRNTEIVRYTPNTITDLRVLREELAQTRLRGYALDNEEHEPGVSCVAMPIFDSFGCPRYAVSITAATVQFTEERRAAPIELLRHTATEISRLLGFRPTALRVRIPAASETL